MASVTDLISSLGQAQDGISVAYPETFLADLTSAYEADMSIPDARIQVLEADLAAAVAEITRLKAHNYELMTTSAVTDGEDTIADEPVNDDDTEDDADQGVDSLFKEKE